MKITLWNVLLIVGIVLVVGCLGLAAWGLLFQENASKYGVTDRSQAALVVQNKSDDHFYIIGIRITRSDGQSWELVENADGKGAIFPIEPGERSDEFTYSGGEYEAFAIEPGDYILDVEYSDHRTLDEVRDLEFYVDDTLRGEFSVRAGRVAIFKMAGGDQNGAMYTPPQLFGP